MTPEQEKRLRELSFEDLKEYTIQKMEASNIGSQYMPQINYLGQKLTTKNNDWQMVYGKKGSKTRAKFLSSKEGKEHQSNAGRKGGAAGKGKPKPKVKCVYCGKEGGAHTMSRWHNDNCKLKNK